MWMGLLCKGKIQVHACLDVAYKYGYFLSLALSEARSLKLGVMLIKKKKVTKKDFNLFLLIILNTSCPTNTPAIPTSLRPHT